MKQRKYESARNGAGNRGTKNEILLRLPQNESDSLFKKLERIELPKHQLLHEMARPMRFVYFLNDGLASLLNVMKDGKSVEVGLIGKEGFVGLPLLAGFGTSGSRVVMQMGGNGYRISAMEFTAALPECPMLHESLVRFSMLMGMQSAHIAACNRLHEVDARLARWLLMSQDRIGGGVVSLTQESLANMLGTRRASVSEAAGLLQKAGLITYQRGDVLVENRKGLEARACECYAMMKKLSSKWSREVTVPIEA